MFVNNNVLKLKWTSITKRNYSNINKSKKIKKRLNIYMI